MGPDEFVGLIDGMFQREQPSAGPFTGSAAYVDSQNHAAGIRAPHAIAALKEATGVARWNLGGGLYATLAAAPANESRPYAALIHGIETPATSGVQLASAWRLYGDDWPSDPTAAFGAFLDRFGLVITTAGVRSKFVARAPADSPLGWNTDRPFAAHHLEDPIANVMLWAHCIDIGAYQDHVAKHRR